MKKKDYDYDKESKMDVNDNDQILRFKKWKCTQSNIVQFIQLHKYFFNCMIDLIIVLLSFNERKDCWDLPIKICFSLSNITLSDFLGNNQV